MKFTKPAKKKSNYFTHSTDFSEKEIYEVKLEPFKSINGKEFINLTISAKSSYAGQSNTLVLVPKQLDDLEKAITEYKNKKILPEAIIL